MKLQLPGIENAFRLGPNLYSGGQPEGDAAFEALVRLGVKTLVSVDGSAPDVDAARRHGLRYVHIPVGYDGIRTEQARGVVKAVQSQPGPVFIHCHHGKHRGPTAAALAGMALSGWTRDAALAWLGLAGTSPEYPGLFATVRTFQPPDAAALARVPAVFPESVVAPGPVEVMVQVDRRWDRLLAARRQGFAGPADPKDPAPAEDARLLAEQFRELARTDTAKGKGGIFLRQLHTAESHASDLARMLATPGDGPNDERRKRLDALVDQVAKDCRACHARHRNP